MAKYFGTDGFRGEANVNLTADHAYKIGRFLGCYFREKHDREGDRFPPRVVIGKDTRRSSYMLEYCLAGGLTASGCDCYLLHVTTTPCVAYITKTDEFDCGIMISASHNPYYDNGIKLINSCGEKMGEEIISQLEAFLDGKSGEVPFATRDRIAKTVDYVSGRNRYMGYLISLGIYSFKGMRIGLDCANGSAWNIAKCVFEALGASVYMIGAEPNGVNINYMTGSTYMDEISDFVKAKRLDVGFAYDGDADRCLCVDEKGNVVDGDKILYISAKYMKEKNLLSGNTVVTTVMSNMGLYKSLDKLGVSYIKTDVGDRFVYEAIKKSSYKLGGEQSGHIIYSKYATTGDGILTSLMIMEIMLATKRKLSDLASEMKVYPQSLINVRVKDKKKAVESEGVKDALRQAEGLLGDKGRILLRASGTEPVIRVMVEAETKSLCQATAQSLAEAVEKTQ
ncbi:MAG: phosphoglucosamine mutase [Clostridia bacterium]|nr:phosphoglucosamine mutase [Clostridia bacterium]